MATTYSVVGTSVTRDEGPDKVSGGAKYPADMAVPGTLSGKILRSPFPHARIISIDTSKARAFPGVHAVLTGADLPDLLDSRVNTYAKVENAMNAVREKFGAPAIKKGRSLLRE